MLMVIKLDNQLFINPKEFLIAEIKVEELIEQLNQSMQTLFDITSAGANGYASGKKMTKTRKNY